MTEDERQKLTDDAIAAERLRTDPAFQRAVTALRADLVKELVAVDATKTDDVRKIQARIWAIDELCGEIATTIRRMPRPPKAVA